MRKIVRVIASSYILKGLYQACRKNKYLQKIYYFLNHRKHYHVHNWVKQSLDFLEKNNLASFVFQDGVAYVRKFNLEFIFVVSRMDGGLLGLDQNRNFEGEEIEHILERYRKDIVFFDIGANFGLYSLIVGKNIANSTVYAFEPSTETCNLLLQNIKHNKLNSVFTNKVALSNSEGEVAFSKYEYSGNFMKGDMTSSASDQFEKVKMTTLDLFVTQNNIQKIDLIKVDVEGAELFVLKGSMETIDKFSPDFIIEISEPMTKKYNYAGMEIVNYLLGRGYKYKAFRSLGFGVEKDVLNGKNFLFSKNI